MSTDDLTGLPLHPRSGDRVRVAIAGGGFAAAEALIALRTLAGSRVELHLVSAQRELALRPLAVAAPFGMEELRGISLADLCADHQATLHEGTVTMVDVARHRLETDQRESVEFDAAIVATGGRTRTAVEGAHHFDGLRGVAELRRLVDAIGEGRTAGIAFAVPDGVSWALPAYELALMTALRAEGRAPVFVVTPERAPLEVFGPAASRRVAGLLAERGVQLVTGSAPIRLVPTGLLTTTGVIGVRDVVALPRIEGPRLPGLVSDANGFLPVDDHLRVDRTANVYAAGDVIAFPVKQGGLATQQADVAARAIAARAGAPVEPEPFRPVLRAMLLTGSIPLFVRGPGVAPAAASRLPLWRPAGKVAARYLSPWLADRLRARLGTAEPFADREPRDELRPADHDAALDLALILADEEAEAGEPGRALEWLEAAEALDGLLPEAYVEKRRRWAHGEAKSVRTVGEPW